MILTLDIARQIHLDVIVVIFWRPMKLDQIYTLPTQRIKN